MNDNPQSLPHPSPLRLAVFDCDGTLVDSQYSIIASMHAAFEHHGFDIPEPEAVRRVVGLPLEVAIRHLAPHIDEAFSVEVSETYKSAFFQLRQAGGVQEPMFAGISGVLDQLDAAGWLMAVATGKSHRGLMATLNHHNIYDRFVTHQTADRAHGKPHPDMMHKAMNATGANREDTIMIGDTTFDIEMAKNAGVRSIGVSWGYHKPQELHDAGAACVVSSADELAAALFALAEQDG
ncbi:HAD-IA family hydrolase [Magnetovibrio sp.]|uniref:HAD-IA family hydrolase n=1 Tax=Magnetovibrio sp. TaxID=2024836 RepID=UPI002F95B3D0